MSTKLVFIYLYFVSVFLLDKRLERCYVYELDLLIKAGLVRLEACHFELLGFNV